MYVSCDKFPARAGLPLNENRACHRHGAPGALINIAHDRTLAYDIPQGYRLVHQL